MKGPMSVAEPIPQNVMQTYTKDDEGNLLVWGRCGKGWTLLAYFHHNNPKFDWDLRTMKTFQPIWYKPATAEVFFSRKDDLTTWTPQELAGDPLPKQYPSVTLNDIINSALSAINVKEHSMPEYHEVSINTEKNGYTVRVENGDARGRYVFETFKSLTDWLHNHFGVDAPEPVPAAKPKRK